MMASALGGVASDNKGRKLIIELHLSNYSVYYLIFFLEVKDFLFMSTKTV
jgi:hypothetical protein